MLILYSYIETLFLSIYALINKNQFLLIILQVYLIVYIKSLAILM